MAFPLGRNNNRGRFPKESTEGLYGHQVLARALRALNSMSGLFLLYHKAGSGHEEATWQCFSEATLHPATHESKRHSFLGSVVYIFSKKTLKLALKKIAFACLTSLREEILLRNVLLKPKYFYMTVYKGQKKKKTQWGERVIFRENIWDWSRNFTRKNLLYSAILKS